MNFLDQQLAPALAERKAAHLWRQRPETGGPQQPRLQVGDTSLLSFCSNDYLGLANHPEVLQAARQGMDRYGLGSGASHLVTGHSHAHHKLEQALAEFTGRDRALLFGSGYMANLGVITTLLQAGDCVFEDRLNHASLLDGGLFSGARFQRYGHLDLAQLETRLKGAEGARRRLIVTDGVFSMDGDEAPLPELSTLASRYEAVLMVDDAHGFGYLGPEGKGLVGKCQDQGHPLDQDNCQVLVGTLGKAFGTAGAFVAGSEALIDSLIQFCRPYIYTTALPPMLAEATQASLRLLRTEHWRREWLQEMIRDFRSRCEALGFELVASATPIQAMIFGSSERAMAASAFLAEQGIQVSAIRPPTVPPNTARLRLTFSAGHSREQFQQLLSALEQLAETGIGKAEVEKAEVEKE